MDRQLLLPSSRSKFRIVPVRSATSKTEKVTKETTKTSVRTITTITTARHAHQKIVNKCKKIITTSTSSTGVVTLSKKPTPADKMLPDFGASTSVQEEHDHTGYGELERRPLCENEATHGPRSNMYVKTRFYDFAPRETSDDDVQNSSYSRDMRSVSQPHNDTSETVESFLEEISKSVLPSNDIPTSSRGPSHHSQLYDDFSKAEASETDIFSASANQNTHTVREYPFTNSTYEPAVWEHSEKAPRDESPVSPCKQTPPHETVQQPGTAEHHLDCRSIWNIGQMVSVEKRPTKRVSCYKDYLLLT